MNLDFRAIRLRTRRQQGLDDDLSVDIVDDVVRLTRSRTNSTPALASIAAHPTSPSERERHDDTDLQRLPRFGAGQPAS